MCHSRKALFESGAAEVGGRARTRLLSVFLPIGTVHRLRTSTWRTHLLCVVIFTQFPRICSITLCFCLRKQRFFPICHCKRKKIDFARGSRADDDHRRIAELFPILSTRERLVSLPFDTRHRPQTGCVQLEVALCGEHWRGSRCYKQWLRSRVLIARSAHNLVMRRVIYH